MGSVEYLAPEAMRGYASPASDVFSAGMILHLLLTGFLPKQDDIGTGRHLVEVGSWVTASAGAKDLMSLVLKTAPNERITAEEANEHNWSRNIALTSHTRKNSYDQELVRKSHFKVDEEAQKSTPRAMALVLGKMLALVGDLQNSAFKAFGSLPHNELHDENKMIAEKELNNLVVAIVFSTCEDSGSCIRRLLDAAMTESIEWIRANMFHSMCWLGEAGS
jgi:serine/threonine protein kinase